MPRYILFGPREWYHRRADAALSAPNERERPWREKGAAEGVAAIRIGRGFSSLGNPLRIVFRNLYTHLFSRRYFSLQTSRERERF